MISLLLGFILLSAEPGTVPPAPVALPDSVSLASEGTIQIWADGSRSLRSLSDGLTLDAGAAEWKLLGGWELVGTSVKHEGSNVGVLTGRPLAAASGPEGLWVQDKLGLSPVGHPERRIQFKKDQEAVFTPFQGGVALARHNAVFLRDPKGRRRCGVAGQVFALRTSPDASHIVGLGHEGLAVWDERCKLVAGAPTMGINLGFLDADRLLVVGRSGELIVHRWPSLEILHNTGAALNDSWEPAEGPMGPVLVKDSRVFDPQKATMRSLPQGTLILRQQGLALSPEGASLLIQDLGGGLIRRVEAGFRDRPRVARVEGGRVAASDGFIVAQSFADGHTDRWELDDPVSQLRLLPDGLVEVTLVANASKWLLGPGETGPSLSPFTLHPAGLRRADGARVHLATADLSAPRALVGDSSPLQVIDLVTLRALGSRIPAWFERVELGADGRLLAGISGERLRVFEVASGEELWSTPMGDDSPEIEIFSSFIALKGRKSTRLFGAETGAPRWTIAPLSGARTTPRGTEAIRIESAEGSWRSDAWGGPAPSPRWATSERKLREPVPGATIATSMGAPPALPTEIPEAVVESWPERAESGGVAEAAVRALKPGAKLRDHTDTLRLDESRFPTLLVYGRAGEIPTSLPKGIRFIRILVGPEDPKDTGHVVLANSDLERSLSLGPGPEALLLTPEGRLLARGTPVEVLPLVGRAGLEELSRMPAPPLPPTWTLRAPSAIEDLTVLDEGAIFVASKSSVAVYTRAGTLLWTAPVGSESAQARGDLVLLSRANRVEARAARDGALLWHRAGEKAFFDGTQARVHGPGSTRELLNAHTGETLWDTSRRIDTERAWFAVPGGWCAPDGACTERDPRVSFSLGDLELWLEPIKQGEKGTRSLQTSRWRLPGVVRARPLDPTRLLVQLGSELGPWASVDARGKLGPVFATGPLGSSREGLVAVGEGSLVRVFDEQVRVASSAQSRR